MNMEHLTYFKKVAETENMSKAAKLLCISQPSLSRIVKQLEGELDTPLFTRNGKNLKLNEAGEIFLNYVNQIIPLLNQAYSDVHAVSNTTQQLSISMLYSNAVFPNLLATFNRQYPNVHLNIRKFENDLSIDIESEVIIHASDTFAKQHSSQKILTEECLLGFSPQHKFAGMKEISLELLSDEKFIILKQSNSLGQITSDFFRTTNLLPHVAIECDNQSVVTSFVALNLGIALFPSITWSVPSESIIYKKITGISIERSIYISTMTPHVSNASKLFTSFVSRYMASHS